MKNGCDLPPLVCDVFWTLHAHASCNAGSLERLRLQDGEE